MTLTTRLGGSRTGQDPQNKVHAAACLVSPSRTGPIKTHLFIVVKVEFHHIIMSLLALLLECYCITHVPSGSVLLAAVTVRRQPCCDLLPLR